jgi:hypothetical protein
MMLIGILSTLLQLAVVIGIIVLVFRLVARRSGGSGHETPGVSLRRFFIYAIMLVTALLAGIGVSGLIEAALESSSATARDTASIARNIAFIVVALPVFVGLALYTRKRLGTDPEEGRSFGWALYLTTALIGSLVAAMSLTAGFLVELLDQGDINNALLAGAIVWTAVWVGHWFVAQRYGWPERLQPHLLIGSAAGLITLAIGAGVALGSALGELYDRLFVDSVVDSGADALVGGLVMVAVGLAVWSWYWIRHAYGTERTVWWLTYVLLVGVLGGVLTAIVGMGTLLFALFDWLVGDTGTIGAAVHFDVVPAALAAIGVGGAGWAYHSHVLGDRSARRRTEVDRVYDHLLSGAGLVVAAGGIATLIAIGVDALGNQEIAFTSDAGTALATALTFLSIGVPLWGRYWWTIRRYRDEEAEAELASPTRRVYLFALFGLSGFVALVDLIVLVYLVLEDVLEGVVGAATVSDIAVPVALLLTTGALAWYHFLVFRADRAEAPAAEKRRALREVILVSSNGHGLREALTSAGTRVSTMHGDGEPLHVESMEQVLTALESETHPRVVVLETEEHGYEVVPLA